MRVALLKQLAFFSSQNTLGEFYLWYGQVGFYQTNLLQTDNSHKPWTKNKTKQNDNNNKTSLLKVQLTLGRRE